MEKEYGYFGISRIGSDGKSGENKNGISVRVWRNEVVPLRII